MAVAKNAGGRATRKQRSTKSAGASVASLLPEIQEPRLARKLLYGKRIRLECQGQAPAFSTALQDMLLAVIRAAPTWVDRHDPARPADGAAPIRAGTRCMYIPKTEVRQTQPGIYFEVGSYVHGEAQDQITLDLDQAEPDIVSGPIETRDGKFRSILHTFRCVALGETLLVHNDRGGGGMDALARYLTHLLRRHGYAGLYRLKVDDVFSPALREAIEAGGGAKGIKLDIVGAVPDRIPKSQKYGRTLAQFKRLFPDSKKASTTITAPADVELAIDEVESAYNESRQVGSVLDQVSIVLRNGKVTSAGKYRCMGECFVQLDAKGVFNKVELKNGLFVFLDELRMPHHRNFRLIDENGTFVNRAPIAPT